MALTMLTLFSDTLQDLQQGQELRSSLPRGHHGGARLQQNVRTLRPYHADVLLP